MSLASVSGFSVATKIFLSDTTGLCSLEYQRSLPCGTGLLKMEAAGHAPCGVGGLMASGSWGASQAANCLVTQSQIFSLSTACGKEPFPQRRRVTCLKALETFLGLSHWGSLRVSPVQHHALPWCSGHCWPRAEGRGPCSAAGTLWSLCCMGPLKAGHLRIP